MSRAAAILKAGAAEMEDRAKTYDGPSGERSMEKCVSMFNSLTGHQLSAEQGWHFMTCLKLVRSQQGGYRADNYVDGTAYFALAGEQAAQDRVPPAPKAEPVEPDGVAEALNEPRFKCRGGISNYKHHCCNMTWFSSVEIQQCPACKKHNAGKWNG